MFGGCKHAQSADLLWKPLNNTKNDSELGERGVYSQLGGGGFLPPLGVGEISLVIGQPKLPNG